MTKKKKTFKFYLILSTARLRGFQETPIVEPFDHVVIDAGKDRVIECKSTKPITWLSEVRLNFKRKI